MSELPREFIARYTAGGAVGIASVCSAHPEILIEVVPKLLGARVGQSAGLLSYKVNRGK